MNLGMIPSSAGVRHPAHLGRVVGWTMPHQPSAHDYEQHRNPEAESIHAGKSGVRIVGTLRRTTSG